MSSSNQPYSSTSVVDACDYPIQRTILMGLATTVVIFIDIGELHQHSVQQLLLETIKMKQNHVTFILTDCKNHDENELEQLQEKFSELVNDAIENITIITTYEMEGGPKNISDVNQEVREAITKNMIPAPKQSLESYATMTFVTEKNSSEC